MTNWYQFFFEILKTSYLNLIFSCSKGISFSEPELHVLFFFSQDRRHLLVTPAFTEINSIFSKKRPLYLSGSISIKRSGLKIRKILLLITLPEHLSDLNYTYRHTSTEACTFVEHVFISIYAIVHLTTWR